MEKRCLRLPVLFPEESSEPEFLWSPRLRAGGF